MRQNGNLRVWVEANSPFSFGEVSQANDFAWSAENAADKTQSVGQKQPNAWGFVRYAR